MSLSLQESSRPSTWRPPPRPRTPEREEFVLPVNSPPSNLTTKEKFSLNSTEDPAYDESFKGRTREGKHPGNPTLFLSLHQQLLLPLPSPSTNPNLTNNPNQPLQHQPQDYALPPPPPKSNLSPSHLNLNAPNLLQPLPPPSPPDTTLLQPPEEASSPNSKPNSPTVLDPRRRLSSVGLLRLISLRQPEQSSLSRR